MPEYEETLVNEYRETIPQVREPKFLDAEYEEIEHLKGILKDKAIRVKNAKYLPRKASVEAIRYVASEMDEKNYRIYTARVKLREGVYGEPLDYNLVFLADPEDKNEAFKELMEKYDERKDPSHQVFAPAINFIQVAYYKDIDSDRIFYSDDLKVITSLETDSECTAFDPAHEYILDFTDEVVKEVISSSSANYTITPEGMMNVARRFVNERKNKTAKAYSYEN